MNKPSQEAITAAAAWWARQLVAPKFDNLGPTRGRSAKETSINDMASMLALMNADRTEPTEEQLATFQAALREAVEEDDYFPGSLYADYGPDQLLTRAAKQAGIDTSRFPWKTGTWFCEGAVTAASGYGAPRIQIYPTEDGAHEPASLQA